MPQQSSRAKRSEKGLLTPDNCVVTMIDLQPQMLFGVANFDRQTVINNNIALAKAVRVFDVPRESCATTTWSALSGCFFASSLSAAFESLPVRPAGIEKLVEPSVSTFFVPFFLRLAVTAPVVFSVSVPVHVPIALRRAGKRELKLSVLGDGRGLRSLRVNDNGLTRFHQLLRWR